ncbi:tetratricopeptide repeat protein [Nonomuraea sp. NN258]|uniref:FxSxx-COOH system tetratricopeptide repeat protein n=1 Tax=Nonomuraea antri TaxID=2730852 RepID=UPI00156A4328|nr:FxSxx-COOH system tetratricopeptide repeat protein [Nonomuraea antri]NRQ33605.1 tetratricopeptide repeat protein [Nonomuraea antri]
MARSFAERRIEVAENAHSLPTREPQIWENVPPRNPNFTGREDLMARIRAGISAVTAVVATPQTLQGLGGVGKTQLAIEYAWQFRSHYDLVWWIRADQPILVPSTLASLAQRLDLPPANVTGVEQAAKAVQRVLESGTPYRRWLIIFDNAEEPEFLKDYIPRGPGHVLITSRNSRWSDYGNAVEVDVFKREESVAFLRKRLGAGLSESDADLLAEKLGDLPLALDQAAALQRRTLMSPEEYITLLEQETGRLLSLEKAPAYPYSMTAAWRVSVSQLEDQIPEAVEVLRCAAFFGPEPFPRDVFRWAGEFTGRLKPILSDPILLTRVISALERFALVKVEPVSRTIQVHRLNQALLRDELSEPDRRALRHEVHMLLAGSAPGDPDDTNLWNRFEELAAHVEPSGLIRCHESRARDFTKNFIRYLYVRGNYASALGLVRQVIEVWTEMSGAQHEDVLVARAHLGNIYRALTRYGEAYEVDSETLDLMREELGPDHDQTLWAMGGYASTLRGRGEFERAREIDEESHRLHDSSYGPHDMRTLRTLNNLGVDCVLTNDFQRAQDIHYGNYRYLSSHEDIGKRLLLQAWSNLCRAVRLNGQILDAAELSQDAHQYGVTALGPDHPVTLQAAKESAISMRRAGRLAESLAAMQDVHARMRRAYGDDHAETMGAALGLSNALRLAGDLEEAERMVRETLRHYPKVFGEEHPYSHACLLNLALLHRLQGDPAHARQIDERERAWLAERLGARHDYVLRFAMNLQSDLAALGEFDAARRLGTETLQQLSDNLSADHYFSLACAANLSIDLRETGAQQESDRLYLDTLAKFTQLLEEDHPDVEAVVGRRRLDMDFDPPPL